METKHLTEIMATANDLVDSHELSNADLALFCRVKFDEADKLNDTDAVRYHRVINKINKGLKDKGIMLLQPDERQKCEIWTRVMGYYRPVSEFNIGKKSEFYERRYFSENKTQANERNVNVHPQRKE